MQIINVPLVLYGCEMWSPALRERHRLRVYENRVRRRIFGQQGRKWREAGEDYVMRSFITCTLHEILLG